MANTFTPRVLSVVLVVAGVTAAQSAPPRKDIPAIAKAANGAIVTIVMAVNDKPIAQGSGFLVSPDGVVVTNYHVIKTGNVAIVKFPDGTVFPVDGVLAADKIRDLAIIKIHGKTFRTLTLGNSDQVQVGEEVVAIGNPLSLEFTVSNGIVSGMRTSKEQGGNFLQTTAPISPGSSGGPLFNMAGEVVGINTLYLEGGENLNFAIPINDAKRLLINQSAKFQNLPDEVESGETPSGTHDTEGKSSRQKACDEQAEKFIRYKRQGYKVSLRSGYVNHYDANVTKCYVETAIDFGEVKIPNPEIPGTWYSGKFYSVDDGFFEGEGGPVYGEFFFHEDGVTLGDSGCHIYPRGNTTPDSPDITCRSEAEFNELSLKYFGTTPPAALSYSTYPAATPPSRPTSPPSLPNSPLPRNTKIAATPQDVENATQAQIWEDIKYCYQNPNNNLQVSDGTVTSCGEINAAIQTRATECGTGSNAKTKKCKGFLKTYKDLKSGRL